MLARLWRREVEAVVEPPPPALPQLPRLLPPPPPPRPALLESPRTPLVDSPEPPRKRRTARRRPDPVARIWLRDRKTPPCEHTPRDHALRLLRWVRDGGYAGKPVLAMDLKKIYPVMCEELDWEPHRWQPVACELRKLTGRRKPYRRVDGHRRRVYRIPKA